MKSSKNKNILIGLFLALLMFLSSFFLEYDYNLLEFEINYLPILTKLGIYLSNHIIISNLIASVFLLSISISWYYLNESYFKISRNSWSLSIIFLFIVSISRYSIFFTKYHLIALCILWALYYNVKFITSETDNKSSLFKNLFYLSIVCIFYPKLIWLCSVVLILNFIFGKIRLVKYSIISVSAILIPFLFLFSIHYIVLGNLDLKMFFTNYFSSIFIDSVKIHSSFLISSVLTVLTTFLFLYIIIYVLIRFNTFPSSKKIYMGILTLYAIFLFLFVIFNDFYSGSVVNLMFYTLLSPLIFECYYNTIYKRFIKLLVSLCVIMIFLDRIYLFLN